MIEQLLRQWRDELLRRREMAEERRQLKYSPDSCEHGARASERCFSCEAGE